MLMLAVDFPPGIPLEVTHRPLPDGVDVEADLEEGLVVQDVAAVEDEGRLHHEIVDLPVVEFPVKAPLRHDGNGVAAADGLVGILHVGNAPLHVGEVLPGAHERLRVRDDHLGVLLQEPAGDVDGRAFPRVARVGLEGESEEADFFPRQCVEHGREHVQHETLLLVLVDAHDALQVVRHFLEAFNAAQIDQVQDVLLEAGPAEADARVEELAADAAVHPHDASPLPRHRRPFSRRRPTWR